MKDDPLKDKSYQFAIRIVKLSQYLQRDKNEYVLSKQVKWKVESKNEQWTIKNPLFIYHG